MRIVRAVYAASAALRCVSCACAALYFARADAASAQTTHSTGASSSTSPPASSRGNDGVSAEEVKTANDPLSTSLSVNLQNYYASALNELPESSLDTFLLRVSTPYGRLLPRFTLPLVTQSGNGSSASGLGDFNAFVTVLLTRPGAPFAFGVGPLYVAPTASSDALGAGKHQLGGAAVLVWSHGSLLLATLVQYQHSIAGDADRPTASILTPQVFGIAQIGGGFYLRSTPAATFNFAAGDYSVPIGLGAGKVLKVDGTTINAFLEPQYTLLAHGAGQPLFQIFTGLNLQWAL